MTADPREIAEEALRLAEGATPGPWFSGAWRADEVRHRPAEAWCNRCGEMRRWVTTDRAPQECSVCGSEECGASPEPIVRCIEDGTEADAAMIAHAGTHYGTLARAYLELVSDLPVVIEAAERDAQLAEDEAFYERDDPGGDVAEADFLCERAKEVRAACERLRALGGG